jgi:hypothetical protein
MTYRKIMRGSVFALAASPDDALKACNHIDNQMYYYLKWQSLLPDEKLWIEKLQLALFYNFKAKSILQPDRDYSARKYADSCFKQAILCYKKTLECLKELLKTDMFIEGEKYRQDLLEDIEYTIESQLLIEAMHKEFLASLPKAMQRRWGLLDTPKKEIAESSRRSSRIATRPRVVYTEPTEDDIQ